MTVDAAFAALADPTRRRLLSLVGERPRPAGSLAGQFSMSRPAVSKHLRVLREAGLIEVEKVGRTRIYRLRPDGMANVKRWMERAERVWDRALESFRRHVEEEVEG